MIYSDLQTPDVLTEEIEEERKTVAAYESITEEHRQRLAQLEALAQMIDALRIRAESANDPR